MSELEDGERRSLPREEAQQETPFRVKEPSFIPNGWVLVDSSVEEVPRSDGSGVAFHVYEEVYQPRGLAQEDRGWVGLQIMQAEETGRPDGLAELPTTELEDGSTAYLTYPSNVEHPGKAEGGEPGGAVTWWSGGVYHVVSGSGLPVPVLIRIANSMVG